MIDRMRVKQLPSERELWPKGLCKIAAIISPSPDDLADWTGLEFFDDYDDLDYFRATLFLVDEAPYALVRHRGCPTPGTEVWIREDSSDPSADVRRCLEGLELANDLITWEIE